MRAEGFDLRERTFGVANALAPNTFVHQHRSLGHALAASGARTAARIGRARGLLHRWFASESHVLAAVNMVLSLTLLTFALTMTLLGTSLAARLGLLVTFNESVNAIAPYAGVVLLGMGGLRLLQHILTRDGTVMRLFGFAEAAMLIAGGAWAEAVAWYTGSIPYLMKPPLELAGGEITTDIAFFSLVIVPFFKPAMAAAFGLLLTAKQIRTTAVTGHVRGHWYIALIGLIASGMTLMIGVEAGRRHLAGPPVVHSIAAEERADRWARQFASPFAPGAWCRVSDTFGPRLNPFYFMKPKAPAAGGAVDGQTAAAPPKPVRIERRIENHPGVDLAARQGTPVQAMGTGTVVFTGSDNGFGNMAAMRIADGTGRRTTFLLGHMSALNVRRGDPVAKGAVIGWVGSTGRSTGPHLHLQVCPEGRLTARGGFACGTPANPYENWLALSAIARLSCSSGPVGL